ncbi:hypothetical protein CMV30_18650 [Nibricoccus aquaticus]|uniref:DUF455 domain-containing protein n=1 Tax=Nibricoccus aquaticus TaxID=2576891 RepID=A0A290QAS4_9BACT|nr:DUF455 family protein [Nibricoccus aquaticus]ATC65805.1 hypothetical protein CMV30_18650 [Nibricoccus aquaticus]
MQPVSLWLTNRRTQPPDMVITTPPANPRTQLTVTQSAVILKRFFFLERELIYLKAGWLPGTSHWESKLLLPEIAWESSLLAKELRQRVLELRYPERRIAIEGEEPLVAFFRRCGDAPTAVAFLTGLAFVVKPRILEIYRLYRSLSDQLDDGPTQRFLCHGISDLERQIARLQLTTRTAMDSMPEQADGARQWERALAALFSQLPIDALFSDEPMTDNSEASPLSGRLFAMARIGARDPRFQRAAFAWPDRHTPSDPGQGLQLQARQAVHHINEVWAAEMAAACIWDLGPTAPHEFLDDAARWCYDEIRHCRMGYERLKEWGFADHEIPLDSFSYDSGQFLDPLTRLGIIFYFEATYIHTKKERTLIFAELGDRLSSHDMDFDWADELIHTYYGKRWLEELLKQHGSRRKLSDVKEDAKAAVIAKIAEASEQEKLLTKEIFDRVMKKMMTIQESTLAE